MRPRPIPAKRSKRKSSFEYRYERNTEIASQRAQARAQLGLAEKSKLNQSRARAVRRRMQALKIQASDVRHRAQRVEYIQSQKQLKTNLPAAGFEETMGTSGRWKIGDERQNLARQRVFAKAARSRELEGMSSYGLQNYALRIGRELLNSDFAQDEIRQSLMYADYPKSVEAKNKLIAQILKAERLLGQ